MGDRVERDSLEFDELVAQQSERPPGATLRRVAARQGDQAGSGLAVDFALVRSLRLPMVNGVDATFGVAFPHRVRSGVATVEGFDDRSIGRTRVGFQEDPRPEAGSNWLFAAAENLLEECMFVIREIDRVLLGAHRLYPIPRYNTYAR